MKKKFLAFLITAALAVGMCPAAAFAAPAAQGDGLMAAQVEVPLDAAAVADPTCVLYGADGYLWQCTSVGAPVSKGWDSSVYSSKYLTVTKVFVASNVTTLPKKAKIQVNYTYSGAKDYDEYIGSSRAVSLQFLTDASGKSACKTLAADAFSSWRNLTSIVGLDKTQVTSFGKNQFSNTALKTIAVPRTLKTIGSYAFAYNKGLTAVTGLDASQLTTIGSRAFNGCSALKSISLPKTCKTIGDNAFNGCSKLTTVKNLNKTKITKVNKSTFYGCAALKSVVLPNTCKTIGDDAFWDCKKLSKITFGSKTTTIGSWAFRGCKSLKSISLPATCKKIGSFAFSHCTSLKKATLKSKTVVRNAKKASYYMDDIFYKTPIAKKGGTARIYVPKSVLSKYKSKSYSNKWHYITPSRFRAI